MKHAEAMGWAVTTAAALAAALCVPLSAPARSAMLLGVSLSAAAGGLAALLIGRAHRQSGLSGALVAMAVPFAVRVLLLAAGLACVNSSAQWVTFVGSFFAVFFTQLLLEIASARLPRVPQS